MKTDEELLARAKRLVKGLSVEGSLLEHFNPRFKVTGNNGNLTIGATCSVEGSPRYVHAGATLAITISEHESFETLRRYDSDEFDIQVVCMARDVLAKWFIHEVDECLRAQSPTGGSVPLIQPHTPPDGKLSRNISLTSHRDAYEHGEIGHRRSMRLPGLKALQSALSSSGDIVGASDALPL